MGADISVLHNQNKPYIIPKLSPIHPLSPLNLNYNLITSTVIYLCHVNYNAGFLYLVLQMIITMIIVELPLHPLVTKTI